MDKTRVLIIDDSSFIRHFFKQILESDPNISVVGTAANPREAMTLIASLKPNVLTLDIEMPEMDGITFLKQLMDEHPLPVIMISSFTSKGADITIEALSLGAIDFLHKPEQNLIDGLEQYKPILISKVKAAGQLKLHHHKYLAGTKSIAASPLLTSHLRVIAIGASTGGVPAITGILMSLPPQCPPIVVTQHIPRPFSASFATRLDAITGFSVHEATKGMRLQPGHVYIAPGNAHLLIVQQNGELFTELSFDKEINHHRPSVDVMMESVACAVPGKAIGILLTGMGIDGAAGMRCLKEAQCKTIAQDESSCVVFGMPKAAIKIEAATYIEPLDNISQKIIALLCSHLS